MSQFGGEPVKSPPGTKGWDIDLTHGSAGENAVLEIIRGRVEVKRDRIAWRTSQVAVEFKFKGKPSGISSTEADWWAFVLDQEDGSISSIVFISTERLKRIARECYASGLVTTGGDGGQSEMVLVPLPGLV